MTFARYTTAQLVGICYHTQRHKKARRALDRQVDAFERALAGFDPFEVEEAFKLHVRCSDAMPAPEDILHALKLCHKVH